MCIYTIKLKCTYSNINNMTKNELKEKDATEKQLQYKNKTEHIQHILFTINRVCVQNDKSRQYIKEMIYKLNQWDK